MSYRPLKVPLNPLQSRRQLTETSAVEAGAVHFSAVTLQLLSSSVMSMKSFTLCTFAFIFNLF